VGQEDRSFTYRGADRRGRSPLTIAPIPVTRLLLFGNAVTAVALGLPLLAAYLLGRTLPAELFRSTQVLSSCLFAGTGLLCLVSWRLVGYARFAYLGGSFALFGLLTVPLPLVEGLLPDGDRTGLLPPLARAAVAGAAVALAARTLRSPAVDSRLRPARLMAEFAGCACLTYLILVALVDGTAGVDRTLSYLSIELIITVLWLAAGLAFVRRARGGQIGSWPGCIMLLIGGQELLRFVSVPHPRPWVFAASTLLLIASSAGLAGAGQTLLTILRRQDSSVLRLSVDLRASEGRLAGAMDRQEERLHDVRSALAAIRCANGTLHRYAARLDERTKATLETALTQELSRLEGLVDPTIDNPFVNFRLADLLGPLVEAERSQGSEILLHVGELCAHGRPTDTAAVVQNLIVNARRYAPGSVIVINAGEQDGRVRLQVEDSGPGIPEREHAAVFERGVRGTTSAGVTGTGLGLFVSSRLMAEQHGSLSLRNGAAGGACFVLDLPAADGEPPAGPPLRDGAPAQLLTGGEHGSD
jgi:signal transduction histidine kinase